MGQHAVITVDEKIWTSFDGHIPRIGEEVRFMNNDQNFRVKDVYWFITESYSGMNRVCESEARIVIEPSTD